MTRHPFDLLMELDTQHVRLDYACLHLSRDVYPYVNVAACIEVLDRLADEVAALRPGLEAPYRYAALREVLVEQHGFRGNDDDYYDPENSYLNRVLERRLGIPISLSIVWIEVARRLKWPVYGVAFPGHFLVRVDDPQRYVLADPFTQGRSLSLEDCRELLQQHFADRIPFTPGLLEPVDTRAVLARLLNNLRAIYAVNQDLARLEQVLHRLRALEPDNTQHVQDLAELYCRMGNLRDARAHLAAYLIARPEADEDHLVRRSLARVEAALAALN